MLIVKLGALGDVLRTTIVLAPLKARHPNSHITWVTRQASRPCWPATRRYDRVLAIEESYLELLMAEQFDLAIGPKRTC
jgi:heptosyltransferase-2